MLLVLISFTVLLFGCSASKDPILDPNFISVREIMNGSETSVIGERALIRVYKEELKNISAKESDEFF